MNPAKKSTYIFQNVEHQVELDRLRSIEAIFDPATRRRLRRAGIRKGSRCLEIGAGAGSVTAWMAAEAGPSGHVTAVDLNTRFLNHLPPHVRVVAGDARGVALEPSSFDVIHARYVLVHIPEHQAVLESLWRALKPGGRLVVEEPDFSVSRAGGGTADGIRSFERVHRAIVRMFSSKGIDPALGTRLPPLLQKLGAKGLIVENDCPISQGGSAMAQMMRVSAAQLRERYVATGEAAAEDIDRYGVFSQDPRSWAVYYATVGVIGRKK